VACRGSQPAGEAVGGDVPAPTDADPAHNRLRSLNQARFSGRALGQPLQLPSNTPIGLYVGAVAPRSPDLVDRAAN